MKRIHFVLFSFLFVVFVFFSCGELNKEKSDPINDKIVTAVEFIVDAIEVENLLDRYNILISSVGIWNDYMPMIGPPFPERFTICPIWFLSDDEIPQIEVFAKIITDRITYAGLLKEIYGGGGTMYGQKFLKDFRPEELLLNTGEECTIEVMVKIFGEYQIILFDKQEVFATH